MQDATSKVQDAEVEVETDIWPDGVEWHAKRWSQVGLQAPIALLIALQGFAEHVGRYEHVWPRFAVSGKAVLAYDQRGAGRSGPRHADTTLHQNNEKSKYSIVRERRSLDDSGLTETPIWLYGRGMVRQA